MMSKEKRRVPKLRFPGFTEDWERRKLTSFTQRVKGNDGRMDLPTLTISASEGWLNQKDRFSANIAGSEQKNYTLLRQGELSYNHGNSKLAKYGVVYALQEYKEALVPRVYHSFKVDESHDALFVEYYFSTKRPDRELRKLISSGARMDGLLNIGYDEFTNISISLPTFSEQKQIVALLKVCDKNITVHQRKIEHLNLKKKALLQKLFPQNGECYPEHRFPGFTDAWEQRKFEDLFEYERPDAYIVKSDNYNNDFNMPVLTANKAFILGYTNEKNSYNKPSIIFDDFTLDRKYVDFPYMLKSSAIKILTSKNQHNLRFLFERLNSTRFEVLGHARHYISVVQNTTTLCPSVDEEVCISNLLTKFDELITLHQRKLEHLQFQKKTLLQQLFI